MLGGEQYCETCDRGNYTLICKVAPIIALPPQPSTHRRTK